MGLFKKFKMRCAVTRASILYLLFPFKPEARHVDTEEIRKFEQARFKFKENAKDKKD